MNNDMVLQKLDQGLLTITMNRPDRRNALNPDMTRGLVEAARRAAEDHEVRAVLLKGAGGTFCVGGDVKSMGEGSTRSVEQRRAGMARYRELALALTALDKPLIAALDGVAFGAGLSIALYADIVLVSTRARMAMVFHRIGLVPDVGAWYTLPRAVGLQRAKELIYSAREFGADEALQMGLALEAHSPEQLMPRALQLAQSFEGASPTAFSQRAILPSVMVGDSAGMRMSIGMAQASIRISVKSSDSGGSGLVCAKSAASTSASTSAMRLASSARRGRPGSGTPQRVPLSPSWTRSIPRMRVEASKLCRCGR